MITPDTPIGKKLKVGFQNAQFVALGYFFFISMIWTK
jgi:hypothetical protein